jgi:hypothetical protein
MTYEETKKKHIDQSTFEAVKADRIAIYAILENHKDESSDDIALALYSLYMFHGLTTSEVQGIIMYFWCSKYHTAKKEYQLWLTANSMLGQKPHISVILHKRLDKKLRG